MFNIYYYSILKYNIQQTLIYIFLYIIYLYEITSGIHN